MWSLCRVTGYLAERSLHKMFSFTSVPTLFRLVLFIGPCGRNAFLYKTVIKIISINLRNTFFLILVISSLDALNCIIWTFPDEFTISPFYGDSWGSFQWYIHTHTHIPWDSWGLLLFLHGAVGSLLQCKIPIAFPWDSWDPCFEIPSPPMCGICNPPSMGQLGYLWNIYNPPSIGQLGYLWNLKLCATPPPPLLAWVVRPPTAPALQRGRVQLSRNISLLYSRYLTKLFTWLLHHRAFGWKQQNHIMHCYTERSLAATVKYYIMVSKTCTTIANHPVIVPSYIPLHVILSFLLADSTNHYGT